MSLAPFFDEVSANSADPHAADAETMPQLFGGRFIESDCVAMLVRKLVLGLPPYSLEYIVS